MSGRTAARRIHHRTDQPRGTVDPLAYAQVAALLHQSREMAPDQLGALLTARAEDFGVSELSVYVADYEQRHLIAIGGSHGSRMLGIDASAGGRAYTTGAQLEEPADGGTRVWSVVVDGSARLGVMSVVFPQVDDAARALADSLAGVVAALLVTRGQCTDAYTNLRRSQDISLAAEMQWQLLPPNSIESGRISVAGLIHPAYEVGGDSFDYALNGDTLHFGVFDAMGHGLESATLAHLAVTSYRHSRRARLGLGATFAAMDAALAHIGGGEQFVTCLLGELDIRSGRLDWMNVGHPRPLLVRDGKVREQLPCAPTLPAGLGGTIEEIVEVELQPGDRLCCITDGVVDSHRPGGEDFGEERLLQFLDETAQAGLDATEMVRLLTHTVLDHHGTLSDDTTVFVVEYR